MRQRSGRRSALISTLAGVSCLALATPAWADSTVQLHQSQVTAGAFQQECNDEKFATKPTDHDGWHFVLPGGGGDFVHLSLHFTDRNGDDVTVTVPQAGDPYPDFFSTASGQVKHAYLFTPAGWTLQTGSATITGTGNKFVLSHTCAGTTQPSTPPDTPEDPDATQSPGAPQPPGASVSPVPSVSPGAPGDGGGNPGEGGGLPITGAAAGTIALVGLALVGGGAALMFIRRRRNITFSA
jgi:LPXTG-motif cell wall-anchored protein